MNLVPNTLPMLSVKKINKNIVLIICARCSSKRFPNKVLKKVGGVPLILQVHERVRYSKYLNKIIVATSNKTSDDKLKKLCTKKNIECYRGSLNNVFSRFRNIIKIHKADIVIRISADSPFIDSKLIDKSIEIFLTKKADIVTNILKRSYPKGQSVEVFDKKIFLKLKNFKLNTYEKEHVSPYFYKNKNKYKIINFQLKNDLSKYNLTIDFREDLLLFNKIIKNIKKNNTYYPYQNLLKFIKKYEN
jgi:spore coat polysaccharide biosynthesis protein SpsF